ncbi:MAG: helix-hairpin-helix domain-containing protein [Halanaerobium sp.]
MLKNNSKSIFILIVFLSLAFLFYYNQDVKQNEVLNSNSDLNLLANNNSSNTEKKETEIIVHLSGAVKNAGVYKLRENDRLVDLIKAAGGLNKNADLAQINLAESLFDGQKLVIPEIIDIDQSSVNLDKSNIEAESQLLTNTYVADSDSNIVNINQAPQSELEKLSGIGPAKAAAVIKYREENGIFKKKEDLLEVSGIGEKTLENIRDEIALR